MEAAIQQNIFLFERHVEVGDYTDGFAIGKYHFPDETDDHALLSSKQAFQQLTLKMNRRIPICDLNKVIDALTFAHPPLPEVIFLLFIFEFPLKYTTSRINEVCMFGWCALKDFID